MIVQPLGELALGMPRANGGSGSDVIKLDSTPGTIRVDRPGSRTRLLASAGATGSSEGRVSTRSKGARDLIVCMGVRSPTAVAPRAAATPWCDAPRLVTRGSGTRQLEPDHRYEPRR